MRRKKRLAALLALSCTIFCGLAISSCGTSNSSKNEPTEKQRYILDLSEKYLRALERFKRECEFELLKSE